MAPPETLDPDEWDAFRALAHRMVDDTLDHLAGLAGVLAWRPMPDRRVGHEVAAERRGPGQAPPDASAFA